MNFRISQSRISEPDKIIPIQQNAPFQQIDAGAERWIGGLKILNGFGNFKKSVFPERYFI